MKTETIDSNSTTTGWRPIVPIPDDAPIVAPHSKYGKPTLVWTYRNEKGHAVLHICRFDTTEGREFLPLTYCSNTETAKFSWRWKNLAEPRPLYNLDKIVSNPDKLIILVEGEKCADAAQQLFPDCVVITSANGAQSPGKTDWTPLDGRDVLAWRDNDEVGSKYIISAYELATAAGAKSFLAINIKKFQRNGASLPVGYDAADALADGWTADEIAKLVNDDKDFLLPCDHVKSPVTAVTRNIISETTSSSVASDSPSITGQLQDEAKPLRKGHEKSRCNQGNKASNADSGHYEEDETGIWYIYPPDKKENIRRLWLCSPIEIIAARRDGSNENWIKTVRFKDIEGKPHVVDVPLKLLAGSGEVIRADLMSKGLRIATSSTTRSKFAEYIQRTKPVADKLERSISSTGWSNDIFILPNGTILGTTTETIVLDKPEVIIRHGVGQKGSTKDWIKNVGRLCQGNSRLLVATSSGFAAPLIRLLNQEPGGINLYATTSTGKTSAARIPTSIYGSPDYMKTWRSTDNGLEGLAIIYDDLPLILDDTQQADPKTVGKAAYLLAGGETKTRANKFGNARPAQQFNVFVISTSEHPLPAYMARAGLKLDPGADVRLVEIPADTGKFGVFENLHGFASGNKFADNIKNACIESHGAVGVEYLRRLCQNKDELPEQFEAFKTDFLKANVPTGASGQVIRVATTKFAFVAFAGELATEYGWTGWDKDEALTAAGICFKDWLDARGGTESREKTDILAEVRLFFELHGDSRFEKWDGEDRTIINRAGFRNAGYYFVLAEVFNSEFRKGRNMRLFKDTLEEAGLLVDRNSKVIRPSGCEPMRAYQFEPFPDEDLKKRYEVLV